MKKKIIVMLLLSMLCISSGLVGASQPSQSSQSSPSGIQVNSQHGGA
jgi:hypothetical protein